MVAITIMTVVAFGIRLWQRLWAMAPIGWESKCGSGHDLLYVRIHFLEVKPLGCLMHSS